MYGNRFLYYYLNEQSEDKPRKLSTSKKSTVKCSAIDPVSLLNTRVNTNFRKEKNKQKQNKKQKIINNNVFTFLMTLKKIYFKASLWFSKLCFLFLYLSGGELYRQYSSWILARASWWISVKYEICYIIICECVLIADWSVVKDEMWFEDCRNLSKKSVPYVSHGKLNTLLGSRFWITCRSAISILDANPHSK